MSVVDDVLRVKRRDQYAKHRDRERAYQRAYYAANRERLIERTRLRQAARSEDVRAYQQEWIRRKRLHNPAYFMLASARQRARKRGLEFNLVESDIVIPSECPILALPIVVRTGRVEPGSPTLDRIDNDRGYVVGNIQVISHRANYLKSNMTQHEAWAIAMRGWPS